jgi:hypothetical protein
LTRFFYCPTLSGIGDGAIAELKDIPELVGFGLEIATDPAKAKATWNGIKSMTPAKVKKMLLGAATDKLAKYTAGGNTMKHEAGKDGVQLAMFVVGAVKSIGTNAAKIAELGGAADEMVKAADEVFTKATGKIDDAGSKTFTKGIKEGDLTAPDADELAEEVKDAATPVDKSWMEIFIKGKQYEKRIDAKINAKDAAYFDDAATKFGNITANDLKGLAEAKQLQINIGNGNFFVADNVFHKTVEYVENGTTKTRIEVWINETKLSVGTAPTKRQGEFLSELSAGVTTFTTRSVRPDLLQGSNIVVRGVIKTGGNGTVSDTFSINKLF